MSIQEKIYQALKMREVSHATFDPNGPGVVRIHLIPPKFSFNKNTPSIAIVNGQDIIPINTSWAILFDIFIKEINKYAGKEINDRDLRSIAELTVKKVKKIYPRTSESDFRTDLWKIVDSLCDIAHGNEPSEEIGYMSINEYAPYMKAPHRMDLMISAMEREGKWNCNQKCLHCYAAGQKFANTTELSTEEWKKVIDICKKIGVPQLTFTGGEPSMRNDLVELVSYSKWFVTRLNTNGVNITPKLCSELFDASLDSMQITLYSSNEQIHNKLVGAKNFERTVNGIKNAINAGLNVSINTPLCSVNRDYLETLKFINSLGVRYVSCSGLIISGNACNEDSKNTQLNEEELFNILKAATEYCAENHIEISFTSPGWLPEAKVAELGLVVPACGACLSNMAVSPDGNVVPCQSWLASDSSLGNILKNSWHKIWNSEKCTKIRMINSNGCDKCLLRMQNEKKIDVSQCLETILEKNRKVGDN